MPWDGTEVWVAPLDDPGAARMVAGGPGESIWQPSWSPDGRLHWVSDGDGWWNIIREGEQLTDEQAELGYPQWLLGGSTYDFLPDGSIVCVRVRARRWSASACCARASRGSRTSGFPYHAVGYPYVKAQGERVVLVAAGPTEEEAVVSWSAAEGSRVVRQASARPARSGVGARAADARVRERRRAHVPRALVPAHQPRLRGSRRASSRR